MSKMETDTNLLSPKYMMKLYIIGILYTFVMNENNKFVKTVDHKPAYFCLKKSNIIFRECESTELLRHELSRVHLHVSSESN